MDKMEIERRSGRADVGRCDARTHPTALLHRHFVAFTSTASLYSLQACCTMPFGLRMNTYLHRFPLSGECLTRRAATGPGS